MAGIYLRIEMYITWDLWFQFILSPMNRDPVISLVTTYMPLKELRI